MKLKEFRKLFRGMSPDAEITIVKDWQKVNEEGVPELESANAIEITYEQPQGLGDDGAVVVYIYHDHEKEYAEKEKAELNLE